MFSGDEDYGDDITSGPTEYDRDDGWGAWPHARRSGGSKPDLDRDGVPDRDGVADLDP